MRKQPLMATKINETIDDVQKKIASQLSSPIRSSRDGLRINSQIVLEHIHAKNRMISYRADLTLTRVKRILAVVTEEIFNDIRGEQEFLDSNTTYCINSSGSSVTKPLSLDEVAEKLPNLAMSLEYISLRENTSKILWSRIFFTKVQAGPKVIFSVHIPSSCDVIELVRECNCC